MISRNTIDELIDSTDNQLNITITLPTHKKGEEVQQDPIRFKNLLTETERRLKEQGVKQEEIESLLKQPRLLLDDLYFWNHADDGMAVYINPSVYRLYKLPYTLPDQVYINRHFLITPILPMISLEGSWNVLALDLKNLRMLWCTRTDVRDDTPKDLLRNIQDFVEEKPRAHLKYHTRAESDPYYFGHGASEEHKSLTVEKYLRGVEKSVTRQMKESGDPLIIAGSEDNLSIYRSINKYPRLLDTAIQRNPGDMSDRELRDAGWKVIQEWFLKEMYEAISQFDEENTERTSNNLTRIIESTVMGKTDTLLIARNESNWGVYDEEAHTVHYRYEQNGQSDELLNWAALKVWERGGKVFVLPKEEMPYNSTVAALFRF